MELWGRKTLRDAGRNPVLEWGRFDSFDFEPDGIMNVVDQVGHLPFINRPQHHIHHILDLHCTRPARVYRLKISTV